MVDIAPAAQVAHAANAQLVVDVTVLTPLLCKPIELGADLVFHSATKYLNGHSDVVAGVVTCAQQNQRWHLRVERASNNAQAFAEHFHNHPQHNIAKQQFKKGFGGMLSIRFKGGREQTAVIMGKLKLMVRATSLGGVESLVEHRALIEGLTSPVPDDLLRFSMGCEAIEDLIADLEQAACLT